MSKEIELNPCRCGENVSFHSGDGCDGCHYIYCAHCGLVADYSSAVDPHNECLTLEELRILCAASWNRVEQTG